MPKVLLVEDNPMNSDLLSRRLRRLGFDVQIVENGLDGVSVAKATLPDLILMDLSLPVMDGWEAIRVLKADDETKGIPIIALTAHAMQEDYERAKEAGCDDYDTKPVEFTRLLGKMSAFVGEISRGVG